MSERARWDVPKVNYLALHTGQGADNSHSSDSDSELDQINFKKGRFEPIKDPVVLVAETPLDTPVIPETQSTDMSLMDEISEAKLAEDRERLEKEEVELAARARALTEQTKLEAKQR